ncbi:tetratricopeptide repeat protein [Geminocystis sp. GBBB08]|uniref:CHAT domain-containing tetratricopeptide repeat protein n=1 Tax=Geminocystis sp. GBBB08 TaxID=2604140 RepID=UPI0027E2894C|nr:tetratricopeptide repeat protein [Geminocystis sp. GBBB08]MBL1208644.1 tetratricopeptide repeat protein [Geminocystis sp. GBBB08]
MSKSINLYPSKSLILGITLALISFVILPIKTIAQNQNNTQQNIIAQTNSEDEAKVAEVEKLNTQMEELLQKGNYREAISVMEKILAIVKEGLGENNVYTAVLINNLGELYFAVGDYKKAESFYQQALMIIKNISKEDTLNTAIFLNNLGKVQHIQGNYREAESFYQQALTITKKVSGEKNLTVATLLNNLGDLQRLQGNYPPAESFYLQALSIAKEVSGEDNPDSAIFLNNLALLYYTQGNYEKAEPLYQQALRIKKAIFGENHPDVAVLVNNLAELYRFKGDYEKAKSYYQESLNISKKILGEKHPTIAQSLNNFGLLYFSLGNYQEAESLYQQALGIRKEVLGENHPDTAQSLNNLALIYFAQGNYQEAESFYQQALAIYQKVLGENHPDTLTALNNLSELYRSQGNYKSAEPLYLQVLTTRKKILGENHIDIAQSLNNLALMYHEQGMLEKAEPLYKESLAIYEKILGENNPDTATSLNNLAELYRLQKRYKEAQLLYEKSLAIRKKLLGEKHSDIAQSLNNLALLYQLQSNYTKAETLFQESLEIYKQTLGEKHPNIATLLNNLAGFYWEENKINLAIDYLTQGTDIEEDRLTDFLNTIGDESRKQAYINTLVDSTNVASTIHLTAAPNNPQAARLALTTILRRKGRVLDALSNIIVTLRQKQTPEIQTLFDNLAQKRSQLASLSFEGIGKLNPSVYQELINNLEQNIRQLEADLSSKSNEFRTINQPITIESVQKAIPKNTALIEYLVYNPYNLKTKTMDNPHYVAYVLLNEGEPQAIDLGETQIVDNIIEKFRIDLADIGKPEDLNNNAQTLYQLIFKPLLPLLQDKKTLLISPDSQLNLIPFVALKDDQGKYLVENYSISYLTSGRDLLRLETQFKPQSGAVIVANPTYNLEKDETLIASVSRGKNSKRSGDLDQLAWCCSALEGTKGEANAIIPLLSHPQVYTENQALAENIIKVKAPQILHLATHGFFLPNKEEKTTTSNQINSQNQLTIIQSENPLLRSGLAFAGFNPADNKMDGALTALDASSLYLWGTKLVVLSACQTGIGDVRNGEGVYGLRRAFVLAGAESQLMSLWDVFDITTQELMTNYYKRLMKGEGRSEALRQVQLEMLKSEKFSHPVHWGAFIPLGDWRNLDRQ